jgi:hypothetical protein
MKNKVSPLAVLSTIAAQVLPSLLNEETPQEWKRNAILAAVPDALAALGELRASNEHWARVEFIGHHAAMLSQTVLETCEDDSQLKAHARRAVKLAAAIYEAADDLSP